MAKCIFIVQGEGRGHLSQSMAMSEYLVAAGHSVELVFAGCSRNETIPDYFTGYFGGKLKKFQSPYFLRTPNQKGIYIGRTLLFQLTRAIIYLKAAFNLRRIINSAAPDVVFNFYDIVGAIALRKVNPGIRRVGIGHHFFLHLDGYRCGNGSSWEKWLLSMHTRVVMKSCDQVLALSFSPGLPDLVSGSDSLVEVIPPLIRQSFRNMNYGAGNRYLVYLLNGGYVFDLIHLSEKDPTFEADVFTTLSIEIDLPPGIVIHSLDNRNFREKMSVCKGLITTAGFDSVCEAAYLGIPILAIPSQHHFEQRCNALDMERNGIGVVTAQITPGIHQRMKGFENQQFKSWVDQAGEKIINIMNE